MDNLLMSPDPSSQVANKPRFAGSEMGSTGFVGNLARLGTLNSLKRTF